MHGVDYDSSDDEYEDNGWSSSFDKPKRTYEEVIRPPDPIDIERLVMNACISGDLATVQQYYSTENATFKPDHILVGNLTALMQAASYSQEHIVKYLLEIGAKPDFKCDGVTSLMCACASSSIHNFATLECVKYLIDKKALINVGDRYGVTPLMKAVMCNKVDIVNLLLMNEVNLEMRNNVGRTAIFYAVEYKNLEIFKILMNADACLDNVDRRGFTILMLARDNECEEILNMLKQVLPSDDEDEPTSSVSDGLNWCDMLPNTSVSRNRPAYSYEITGLLHGMNCERLEPLISAANIDLATFLTLDDEGLKTLGVNLPYERLKILVGLHSFHMHGWNTQCVLGLTNKRSKCFEPLKTLDILSSHMKNVTILQCSMNYCVDRFKNESLENSPNRGITREQQELDKEITQTLNEIKIIKQYIVKINNNNLPPADLILPSNPPSAKSFKKTKMIVCSVSIIMLTVIVGVKLTLNH